MKAFWLMIVLLGVFNEIASIDYASKNYLTFCSKEHHTYITMIPNADLSAFCLTDTRIYELWDNSTDFLCSFEVHGVNPIAIVLENINLRQDPSTKDCIDFIQFRSSPYEDFAQFCGNLSALTYKGNETAKNSPYLNFPHGVYVQLSIRKEVLTIRSKFKFSVSFTAWKDYSQNDLPLDYVPCGKTNTCIWNGLFCDGSVNCPFNGFLDETSCARIKAPKPTFWEVLFTFEILDLLLLAFVGLCVYLCRKYCCGKNQRNTSESESAPPVEEHPPTTGETIV